MASNSAFAILTDTSALKRRMNRIFNEGKSLAKPLNSTRGAEAIRILRLGTRGIRSQFADQTEYRGKSAIPWKKGHDFGIKKAPAKTMIGTGAYMSAFLGGAGRIQRITANSVEVGVDPAKFPQVKIHQGRYAVRVIKPKQTMRSHTTARRRNKNGSFSVVTKSTTDYNMRWFLGLTYGAWMSKARIKKGLRVARRRVSVASATRKEISTYLARDIKARIRGGARV